MSLYTFNSYETMMYWCIGRPVGSMLPGNNMSCCYGNSSFSRLLALKNAAGAEAVFIVFTHKHPDLASEEPPYRHAPLANFLWFLLSTITSSRYPRVEGRGRGRGREGEEIVEGVVGEGRGREWREILSGCWLSLHQHLACLLAS